MKACLALLFLMLVAHAGKRRPPPDFIEDVLAYATIDRDKALVLIGDALDDPRKMNAHAPLIYLHAAEQYRLAGDPKRSHPYFVKVLEIADRGPDVNAARLGLALLEAGNTPNSSLLNVLLDVPEREVLDTQNADRYTILAEHALKTSNPRLGQYTRKALAYSKEDPAVEERVRARLTQLSAPGSDRADPSEPPSRPGFEDDSLLTRARRALAAGQDARARELAEKIITADSEEARAARYLLRHLDAVPVNPRRIGVLLPMTGKYEPASRQVREALEFGFAGSSSTLRYYDSEANPEKAVAMLEQAVFDDGVVAMVGPLLTDETEPVYEAAQAMGVPLISLSQALDPAPEQDWLFQGMVTAQTQVAALLDHVMGIEQLEKFAVFAPDSPYGRRASEAFQAGVAERGGTITVVTYYDSEATDLMPFAKELGRKDYEARAWEFQQLKNEAERRHHDRNKVVLPPTLDFDAIFIPDNARRVPVACAALAYEEFPMGDFRPYKNDSPHIPLLGLSGWNHPSLVGQGGPYARGSFFTDSFLPPYSLDEGQRPAWRPDERTAAFSDAYRLQTGRTPRPLEAVTADVGRLLAAATHSDPGSREAFREALVAARPSETITGATGFGASSRRPDWKLRILTINKDGIVPVLPPEPPADEEGRSDGSTDPQ